MTDRKAKFGIISYFQKSYHARYGRGIVINKYAAQWDADALIDSYGVEPLKQMIDRYIALGESPTWKGFCNSAQKIWEAQAIEALDKAHRDLMKENARRWMSE